MFRLIVPRQLCSELHHALNKAALPNLSKSVLIQVWIMLWTASHIEQSSSPKSQQVSTDTGLNNEGQILCQVRTCSQAASAANSGFSSHESPYGAEPEITGLRHLSMQPLGRVRCQGCSMFSVQWFPCYWNSPKEVTVITANGSGAAWSCSQWPGCLPQGLRSRVSDA